MPFYIGEKVYREGVDLSRDEFYDMLRKGVDVSTSQPSPTEVMDMWKEMLKEYEEIVYIPLSSALSGSCMTAEAMANEDEFAGKVFVMIPIFFIISSSFVIYFYNVLIIGITLHLYLYHLIIFHSAQ